MRGGNSFTNMFSEDHNIRYLAKQLEYLEKSTALFLLDFFTSVYANIGKSKAVLFNEHSKSKLFELLTLKAKVDVKVLPMAWNTTNPLREDRHCDLEGCIDPGEVSCILICEYAYHFKFFT